MSLEHHSLQKRKRIAIGVTLIVAAILIAMMVAVYRSPHYRSAGKENAAIKDFFSSLQNDSSVSPESPFGSK